MLMGPLLCCVISPHHLFSNANNSFILMVFAGFTDKRLKGPLFLTDPVFAEMFMLQLLYLRTHLNSDAAAGSMPEDFEMYYGFTRFAIELNETDQDQVHLYPPTDTRFRTDQR